MHFDLSLFVFDSSGHLVATLLNAQVAGPPADLSASPNPFIVDGQNLLTVSSSSGDFSATWNGIASDGYRAYPGTYTIQAKYTEIGKDVVEIRTVSFSLTWGGSQIMSSMVLAPNPAVGKKVRLFWKASPNFRIRAKIYNVPGELISIHTEDAAQGYLDWNLDSASGQNISAGVYIWALEILDSRGEVVERGFKKLVVAR